MKTRRAKTEVSVSPERLKGRGELFALYRACARNANELRAEAGLLQKHGHHARAFFLAVTAFEEIGKSQIVADFLGGHVSESEFRDAFHNHRIKLRYNSRCLAISTAPSVSAELEYESTDTSHLERAREASLYVESAQDLQPILPREQISADDAEEMLQRLDEEIQAIESAEWLNQRIGSAGLFK